MATFDRQLFQLITNRFRCWDKFSLLETIELKLVLPFSCAGYIHGLTPCIRLLRSALWRQHRRGTIPKSYLIIPSPLNIILLLWKIVWYYIWWKDLPKWTSSLTSQLLKDFIESMIIDFSAKLSKHSRATWYHIDSISKWWFFFRHVKIGIACKVFSCKSMNLPLTMEYLCWSPNAGCRFAYNSCTILL